MEQTPLFLLPPEPTIINIKKRRIRKVEGNWKIKEQQNLGSRKGYEQVKNDLAELRKQNPLSKLRKIVIRSYLHCRISDVAEVKGQ